MKHALPYGLILVVLCATPVLLSQVRTGGMGVAGGAHMSGAMNHGGPTRGHSVGFRPARPGIVGGFHHHGFRNNNRNRFLSPFWSTGWGWDDLYSDDGEQIIAQQPANLEPSQR